MEFDQVNRSHGLSLDQSIKVEKIILACFQNPSRKMKPDFPEMIADWYSMALDRSEEKQNPEYFIQRVSQELQKACSAFDQAEIRVHNTENLWEKKFNKSDSIAIDKHLFLRTIKESSWYGPYLDNNQDCYSFLSISDQGYGSHFVELKLQF